MSLPFRKLGLGAGGIKGVLHIGALRELQKYQSLQFPDGIYGCSVGSVIATYLSFNLPMDDKVVELTKKYLTFEKIVPKPSFQDIRNAYSEKGMFSMELFEKNVVNLFLEAGIEIQDKKIGDAPQPLYIIASNITKGIPTIFTKDVPILDAIKCSCCLPAIFKPQNLYGQLYVDGGLLVPCISWIQPDALVFSLTKQKTTKITPETIANISPLDFMKNIYAMSINHFMTMHRNENIVTLSYPDLHSDSDLEEFDLSDVLHSSETSLRGFLAAKGLLEKLPEVVRSGSPDHLV
jgi:hypothetical protein